MAKRKRSKQGSVAEPEQPARLPPNAGKGRPPGSQNKITRVMKEAFRDAFDDLGGVEALVKWGKSNPTEFYKLAARLIPVETINAHSWRDKPARELTKSELHALAAGSSDGAAGPATSSRKPH